MKAELVRKTDEFIRTLLDKPELTTEEYMILERKLNEIRAAEIEAARKMEAGESEKRMKAIMETLFHHDGGVGDEMQ